MRSCSWTSSLVPGREARKVAMGREREERGKRRKKEHPPREKSRRKSEKGGDTDIWII